MSGPFDLEENIRGLGPVGAASGIMTWMIVVFLGGGLLVTGVIIGLTNLIYDPFAGAAETGPKSREAICAAYHAGLIEEPRRALFGWNGCSEGQEPRP
jgi:hypothetical protein